MEALEKDATYEQLAQANSELLDERNEALDEVARLRKELELREAAEEANLAMLRKVREERDALATDRADLIKELIPLQNMTHGLACSGGCSFDYPNDAKATLERVTGGHAPFFEDGGPNAKSLARRDALKQKDALEKMLNDLRSDIINTSVARSIFSAIELRIETLHKQAGPRQ